MEERKEIFYLVSYGLIRLLNALPYPLYRLLTAVMARIMADPDNRINRLVANNLGVIVPDLPRSEKRRLTREVYHNAALDFYEGSHLHKREFLANTRLEGKHFLEAALAEGKGVVGLSAHQGNFPLLLAYLSRQGFPVATISREVSNHLLENYIQASKRLSGIRWMPKHPKATAARQMIAWIKKNRVLVILADQHSGQGITVPFFGLNVGTPSGPAVFARRLGCPILPMTVVRKAGHHLIRILPPLELQKTDNPQADIEANTALCNRTIEAWVRENPGQWFTLLSRRFR